MKSLLITGASGYVGRNLVSKVSKLNKYDISVLLRKRDNVTPKEIRQIIINDFTKIENSFSKLGAPDLIVHLAGIAHKKNIKNDDFISINVDVTSKLYNWAVEVNAEKFIFLSSIGVNGQVSVSPLDEMSNPNPQEFYAESKLRAENAITLNKDNNDKTKYVIIRSPLIYGLNAPGNFKLLKKWINSPLPLPFGKANNKRSIISINNLTDFIIHTFSHPSASNETFLVSDLEPLSTKELVNIMIGSNN